MGNISDDVAEKIKTHILCSILFFSENHADYEIVWNNTVGQTIHRWQYKLTQKRCDLHNE